MAMLFSLRGSLCIYQGEELGLDEAEVPFELMQDSFGITHWPKFKGRDGCRTPIPWNEIAPAYGFSSVEKTWLPISSKHGQKNTVSQSMQNNSVLNTTKRLIKFRNENLALRLGDFSIEKLNDQCLKIERHYLQQTVKVILNFSDQVQSIQNRYFDDVQVIIGLAENTGKLNNDVLDLPPFSATFMQHAE